MPAAMPAAMPEPTGLIPAVRVVHLNLTRVLDDLSDAESRRPSRLPGWSRGHVVTHLARNADGLRRMLEGAIAGTVTAMYEGGAASRAADIEAGADRPASVLRDDAISAAAAVDVVWAL